jgi:hypothetical protein
MIQVSRRWVPVYYHKISSGCSQDWKTCWYDNKESQLTQAILIAHVKSIEKAVIELGFT